MVLVVLFDFWLLLLRLVIDGGGRLLLLDRCLGCDGVRAGKCVA